MVLPEPLLCCFTCLLLCLSHWFWATVFEPLCLSHRVWATVFEPLCLSHCCCRWRGRTGQTQGKWSNTGRGAGRCVDRWTSSPSAVSTPHPSHTSPPLTHTHTLIPLSYPSTRVWHRCYFIQFWVVKLLHISHKIKQIFMYLIIQLVSCLDCWHQ